MSGQQRVSIIQQELEVRLDFLSTVAGYLMLASSARIITIAWKLWDASLIGCCGPAQSTNVIIRLLNRKYQTCLIPSGAALMSLWTGYVNPSLYQIYSVLNSVL